MFETLSSVFSNRELASGFWMLILLCFVLSQPGIRGALGGVLLALFQIKIVVLFSTLACWLSVGVLALWQIGWWTPDQLKLSIFWYLFSGAILLVNSIQNQRDASFFSGAVADQFKAVAVLEFIVVFYSFAFWTEMIILPVVAIIATMQAMSETKAEYAAVKKILDSMLFVVVAFLIIHFVHNVIRDHGTLVNLATLREVTIPILYTLWALPFCYLWWCFARWEEARFQLNMKTYHADDLRSYAKDTFLRSLFLRPVLLKRAVRQFNSLPAKSRQDVLDIIAQVQAYETGRRNPETIEANSGWSPYAAEKFLSAEGYETNDFHDTGFDGEWFAESQTNYLKGAGPFDNLIYRIKGQEGVVNALQIKGSFKIDPAPDTGLTHMAGLCLSLIRVATDNDNMPSQIVDGFEDQQDALEADKHHRFALTFTRYEDANILDVEFTCAPFG